MYCIDRNQLLSLKADYSGGNRAFTPDRLGLGKEAPWALYLLRGVTSFIEQGLSDRKQHGCRDILRGRGTHRQKKQ